MRTFLNRFILDAPRLFIKQYAYAWIIFIALWSGTLNIALICPFIILLGLFLLKWQHLAWIEKIRAEYASSGGKFYMENPPVSLKFAARNILILIAAAAGLSYFLRGQIGLTAIQLFLIIVGFSLLYRNAMFFGSPTTYIITDSGLGIYYAPGHLDYRLFLKFNEIANIERCLYQKDKGWDCFARVLSKEEGLLISPKDPKGFTKQIEKPFIFPENTDKFLEQLPSGFR